METPTFGDIFRQMNINLKLCGIHLDGSSHELRYYIMFLLLALVLVEEISFFTSMTSSDNFLALTALAPCIGMGTLSLAKITVIVKKRQRIRELMNCLQELYEEIVNDIETSKLVVREINQVKSVTKFYFILNAVLICVYNFSTLFLMLYMYITKGKVDFILPYDVIVPFSTEVWQNWLVVYIHLVLGGFICVLYYTTVDALYCNLSCQVCSNFTIISKQIKQLTPDTAYQLSSIVKRHQYILQLSEILEEIFTAPNLINVLVGSVEICALGFNLMTGDWNQMPGFALFIISELLQILVMCVFGEKILNESRNIGQSAYTCEWYNMDKKSKKMILIIMVRSHKPQRLTAYKFSVISYGSFTKIISTSWSYFTILKTIYKPSDVVNYE